MFSKNHYSTIWMDGSEGMNSQDLLGIEWTSQFPNESKIYSVSWSSLNFTSATCYLLLVLEYHISHLNFKCFINITILEAL